MEPARFFTKIIQSIATIFEMFEATVFSLGDNPTNPRLLLHVRPNNAPKEQIANSLKIFQEVAKNCIDRNQDLALMVNDPQQKDAPVKQFCLTHLVRQQTTPRFVVSFVSRCRSNDEATKKIALVARLTAIWQDELSFDAVTSAPPITQTTEARETTPVAEESSEPAAGESSDAAPASDTAESTNG